VERGRISQLFPPVVAEDWDVFIVVASPLAEDLLAHDIYEIWAAFREGYMIHVREGKVTPAKRQQAKDAWRRFVTLAELRMPITMMTVSTHFVGVEADHQIEYCGKIREAMSSWIERVCGAVVEDTRRRRVCVFPETSMIRSCLLRGYLDTHRHLFNPTSLTKPRSSDFFDVEGDDTDPKVSFIVLLCVVSLFFPLISVSFQFLGKGVHYVLEGEELKQVWTFLRLDGAVSWDSAIPKVRGRFVYLLCHVCGWVEVF